VTAKLDGPGVWHKNASSGPFDSFFDSGHSALPVLKPTQDSAMARDDLNTPLGFGPDSTGFVTTSVRDIPWGGLALGGIAAIAGSLVAFVVITDDGRGGQPQALVPIERVAPQRRISVPEILPAQPRGEDVTASIGQSQRALGGQIETESGVKVVRRGGGEAPGALIIRIPDELGIRLTPAPDRRLVAKGLYGPLPKIGADGSRPSEIYARPVIMPAKLSASAPRIAIVVGGMGLSQAATASAIDQLPAAVTLAFAPYGANLEKQVADARTSGHEILLQVPMEGFDESKDAGGPRVLTSSATPDKTLDALHWHMSRFSGYVGLMNFLGGRFTTSQAALSPVMRDAADRGLVYFDDGSSPQSLATTVAASTGVPAARADVVIDLSQRPEAIEAALQRLEAVARQKGSAIGVASGLPHTVDRITRFTQGVEARGLALVPLTALITSPARTSLRDVR
jgi:polysaccharide deacetylase 2 family uncharacterized protein YibQ